MWPSFSDQEPFVAAFVSSGPSSQPLRRVIWRLHKEQLTVDNLTLDHQCRSPHYPHRLKAVYEEAWKYKSEPIRRGIEKPRGAPDPGTAPTASHVIWLMLVEFPWAGVIVRIPMSTSQMSKLKAGARDGALPSLYTCLGTEQTLVNLS